MTKFGPELVAVLHVVLQLDVYKENSRPAGRIRFLLPNFGKLEQTIFDLFRQLALDLIGGCTWIDGGHNAGADRDARILHAWHVQDRLSAEQQESES